MFRPRPRDDRRPRPRPRDRRKEDEGKEEPKARLDFFVASLPNVPEMDICTDDANEDERFLHFGERRRTEGIHSSESSSESSSWMDLSLSLSASGERARVMPYV